MESQDRSDILRVLAAIVALALLIESGYYLITADVAPSGTGLLWLAVSFAFVSLALLAFTVWYEKRTHIRVRILTGPDQAGKLFHLFLVVLFATIIGGMLIPEGKLRFGLSDILFTLFFVVTMCLMLGTLLFRVFRPLTNEELKNPQSETLLISIPYSHAFELCRMAVRELGSFEMIPADQESGKIIAREKPYIPTLLNHADEREVTITVKRVDATNTAIVVFCTSLAPNLRTRIPSAGTSEIVKKISTYLKKHSQKDNHAYAEKSSRDIPPVLHYSGPVPVDAYHREKNPVINPVLPPFLSLFIPGLGQSYNGQFWKGIMIVVGVCIGILHFFIPGVLIWIFSIYDAWMSARKINEDVLPFRPVSVLGLLIHLGVVLIAVWIVYSFIMYFGVARLFGQGG
jgi:hypothetical protein